MRVGFQEPLALIADARAEIADPGNDPWQCQERLHRAGRGGEISGGGGEQGRNLRAKAFESGGREAERLRAAIPAAGRQALFQSENRFEQVRTRGGEGRGGGLFVQGRGSLDHFAGGAAALRERGKKRLELAGEPPSESPAGEAQVLAEIASRVLPRSLAVERVEDGGERRLRAQVLALDLVEHREIGIETRGRGMPAQDLRAEPVQRVDLREPQIAQDAPPVRCRRRGSAARFPQIGLDPADFLGTVAGSEAIDALADPPFQLGGGLLAEGYRPQAGGRQRLAPAHARERMQTERHEAVRLSRAGARLEDSATRLPVELAEVSHAGPRCRSPPDRWAARRGGKSAADRSSRS